MYEVKLYYDSDSNCMRPWVAEARLVHPIKSKHFQALGETAQVALGGVGSYIEAAEEGDPRG